MKILITGGHLTPALSFIDYTLKHHSQDKLVFVGREYSQDALQQKAIERYEVEKRKVPFVAFQAVRLGGQFIKQPLSQLRQFKKSVTQAKEILEQHRPAVVMSFGGYLAVPIAMAAKKLQIPLVTHEQTMTSGLASRLIGRLADKVAVTFPETRADFNPKKTVITGNPLRAGVFSSKHPRPKWLAKKLDKPLVLIMGGNQGAKAINDTVAAALSELTKHWTVVHQCGKPTAQQPYKEILLRSKQRLPKQQQQNYYIKEWIDEDDLFWLYRQAFCAISRSGANATQELTAAGLPAILIPLPTARHNEQYKNAQWMVRLGGAVILAQSALKASSLLKSLQTMKTVEQQMRASLAEVALPENATQRLYELAAATVKTK